MAKPIQYCKVKLSNKIIIIKKELTQSELRYLAQGDAAVAAAAAAAACLKYMDLSGLLHTTYIEEHSLFSVTF